jgi:hypothetical protein
VQGLGHPPRVPSGLFFWAAHRSAALACQVHHRGSLPLLPSRQRFPCGRAAFRLVFSLTLITACLNRAFASEPPRRIPQGRPAQGKRRSPGLLRFKDTPHPRYLICRLSANPAGTMRLPVLR